MPTINLSMDQAISALQAALQAVRELNDETPAPSNLFGVWLSFFSSVLRFVQANEPDAPEDPGGDDTFDGFADGFAG